MPKNSEIIKVLMLSSDRNILSPGSAVSERMKEYANLVNELHIVLLCDASHGLKATQLSPNSWVYPTNSSVSFLRPWDAAKIGKKLVYEQKFVRGQSVISTDSIEGGWAGLKIKRRWRLPLEVQIHNDPFSPYFSGFQNWVRKLHANKVLKKADMIRCVSTAVAQQIANRVGAEKVYVLPIYIDKERLGSGHATFDVHARYGWRFVLLSVARLEFEKNLSLAIEALALVRQRYPEVGLLVVGSGSEEGKLKALVKKLNLNGYVEFLGWQNDVTSFYKTSNLFIQTSYFEGYGLSLVEAGLSGLPVVTTPVGIAQELENGKDAYICAQNDVNAFAQSIIDLMENNFKRENLQINLKRALESKLITKEEFLEKLSKNWKKAALLVG
jgi:glycosyltransferase involved in cell wall biosynthesis